MLGGNTILLYLSVVLSACLSVCQFSCMSVCLSVHVYLSVVRVYARSGAVLYKRDSAAFQAQHSLC